MLRKKCLEIQVYFGPIKKTLKSERKSRYRHDEEDEERQQAPDVVEEGGNFLSRIFSDEPITTQWMIGWVVCCVVACSIPFIISEYVIGYPEEQFQNRGSYS